VAFTEPGGSLGLPADSSATVGLGVQEEGGDGPKEATHTATWHVVPSPGVLGVRVSPASGSISVVHGRTTTPLRVTSGSPGTFTVTIDVSQGGRSLPSLVLDVEVSS
jgi:hypothetical protein